MITLNSKPVLNGLAAVIILVLAFAHVCSNTQAQTTTTFTPADRFTIPEFNCTISFAVNGSYSAATFENGAWNFKDLKLNPSQSTGNLKISAENSNVTVSFYRAYNSTSGRSAVVRYTVKGQGKQSINLGLNSSRPTKPVEWSVIIPGTVFLAEGEGWNLLPDDTVVITVATNNMTVVYYSFGLADSSNLPFNQQHSIAIITAIVLALTGTIVIIIRVKKRK